MVRARLAVLAAWIVAAIIGALCTSSLSGLLTTPLAVPGTPSAVANQILLEHFGENIAGNFTVVVPIAKTGARGLARDEVLVARAARQLPTGGVTEQRELFGVLFADVNTTLDLSRAAAQTSALRHALAAEGLRGALVTGPPALQHDLTPVLASDLRTGELAAFLLALVVLLVALGFCGVAVVPLVVAAATIGVDVGVVYLLAHVVSMVLYTPNVIELIALGLAMDYSLLVVHRFSQELSDGALSVEQAVVATLRTAGRTVVISSGIVAIGLAVLACVPVPFLRSLGIAGLVVPLVAMLSSLTLVPALLSLLGRRGVRPIVLGGLVSGGALSGGWARLAKAVVARPRLALGAALVLLALCSVSALWLQLTPASTTAIPQGLPAARGLNLLSQRVGPGAISPDQVVIDLGHAHRATSSAAEAATLSLATDFVHDPEVFAVGIGEKPPFVDATGRYEQILVFARDQFGAEASQQLVDRLRANDVPRARFGAGARIYVGGVPAQGVDFLHAVYDDAPWIVLAALALALVVLARTFRSLSLALVSVVLNLISVVAALGLVVLCTRFEVGATLFGAYKVSQIEGWVPVFLFAVLFGLSMDYEVFLVSRMREAYDAGSSTADAVVAGISRTGGVISAAAVILIGAVGGLVFGQVAGLQELGEGLGLGILVDVTVIRGLLLPSVMTLLGRWAWWLPSPAARLLRTSASPLRRGARP